MTWRFLHAKQRYFRSENVRQTAVYRGCYSSAPPYWQVPVTLAHDKHFLVHSKLWVRFQIRKNSIFFTPISANRCSSWPNRDLSSVTEPELICQKWCRRCLYALGSIPTYRTGIFVSDFFGWPKQIRTRNYLKIWTGIGAGAPPQNFPGPQMLYGTYLRYLSVTSENSFF